MTKSSPYTHTPCCSRTRPDARRGEPPRSHRKARSSIGRLYNLRASRSSRLSAMSASAVLTNPSVERVRRRSSVPECRPRSSSFREPRAPPRRRPTFSAAGGADRQLPRVPRRGERHAGARHVLGGLPRRPRQAGARARRARGKGRRRIRAPAHRLRRSAGSRPVGHGFRKVFVEKGAGGAGRAVGGCRAIRTRCSG
jgi:hypothetical protein